MRKLTGTENRKIAEIRTGDDIPEEDYTQELKKLLKEIKDLKQAILIGGRTLTLNTNREQ